MSYLISIKTAVIVFPIVALFFTIPFILQQYHRYGSIHKFRVLIIYSFILYVLTMYFLVILPLPSKEEVANLSGEVVQFIPFSFIGDIICETHFSISDPTSFVSLVSHPSFYTTIFNVVMTIPFGVYLRYYFKCSFKKTVLFTFLLSLFFEFTQVTGLYGIYPRPYRLCDVDDLITNTFGGICGYWLAHYLQKYLPSRARLDQDALDEGKKVSGLRRICLFLSDSFFFLFTYFVLEIFVDFSYLFWLYFVIYFAVIPTFLNGQTLVGRFLNVRFNVPSKSFLRYLIRACFLYYYYLGIPYLMVWGTYSFATYFHLEVWALLMSYLIVGLFILFFYLFHFIVLLCYKRLYYDDLLKITYESTIIV